jgi:sulfane dehydrogenase subunit SoxC
MIIETGLKTKQIEALLFRAQEAMIPQDEFFSILNRGGASALLKQYLSKNVLRLIKPDQMEMDFEAMAKQDFHTNTSLFFTFTQGHTPEVNIENWNLSIEGEGVETPLYINYNELLKLPFSTVTRYLECAHNGSIFYDELLKKKSEEPQWHFGGYGIAEWTGVRLGELLKRAKIIDKATDVLLVGLDGLPTSRPIPVSKAIEDDTLLAYIMNGQILPLEHGFPLRAIVPGWVGAASVKWVTKIVVSTKPVQVVNNTEKYVLTGPDYSSLSPAKKALTNQLIKSACCLPWPATLEGGHRHITGYAWSPFGKIARVDVSIDQGKNFDQAILTGPNIERAGTRWEYHFEAVPGEITIMPRATDEKGNTQFGITQQKWNQYGYLFGAMVPHPVTITTSCCDKKKVYGDYSMMLPDTVGCC